MKTAEKLEKDRQERLERPGNIMGEGGEAGNGQSRVEKMRCPIHRNAQDGLSSKVRCLTRECGDMNQVKRKSTHVYCNTSAILSSTYQKWDVMAHWLRRLLSTGGSWVRLPLLPSRRDLGQVLYLQLAVRFGVKLRYSICAVVGSASEW